MKTKYFLPKEELEAMAVKQVEETADLDFVEGVAVMPDAHVGMGSTVGSVIATKNAVIPAAVGVDIGCGMIAVKTKYFAKDLGDDLKKLRLGIERRIPLSAGKYNTKLTESAKQRIKKLKQTELSHYHAVTKEPWENQLGSLGSGNHFIELCLDEDQRVWVVLHSGSRGIGNKLAERHIKTAQKLLDTTNVELKNRDLAWLKSDRKEFDAYIADLLWAQDFALLNREEMMDRVMTELSYFFFGEDGHQKEIEVSRINCHHNFTQCEHHHGQYMWITRKGAIEMQKGQLGIIPGSMGTRSYVVEGLGNPDSYNSAPHGAGRRFSRKEARRRFTMADFDRELAGVEVNRSEQFIDEIPSAYKDIDKVMEYAKPLVTIKHTLKQILNIKGN
jgi:tRNA-splicing ligase RtcB (3'-phosphate/5'-hydroxy nucleic acid ligase)